jgi:hypothetical protein
MADFLRYSIIRRAPIIYHTKSHTRKLTSYFWWAFLGDFWIREKWSNSWKLWILRIYSDQSFDCDVSLSLNVSQYLSRFSLILQYFFIYCHFSIHFLFSSYQFMSVHISSCHIIDSLFSVNSCGFWFWIRWMFLWTYLVDRAGGQAGRQAGKSSVHNGNAIWEP